MFRSAAHAGATVLELSSRGHLAGQGRNVNSSTRNSERAPVIGRASFPDPTYSRRPPDTRARLERNPGGNLSLGMAAINRRE